MDAIYARISDDREGNRHGVIRQIEDSQALATRHGRTGPIPDEYIFEDDDISASTRSKKERPAWNRLIDKITSGDVDRVFAYSNSRLTRRLRELEDLVDLHRDYGVTFYTVVGGSDDMSTADGRMVARIKASVDAAEAERIGERVARQKLQRAQKGLPQGGRERLYGYTRDWQVVDHEAVIVREAFKRKVRGESTTSIARSLAERGLVTVAGKPWSPQSLGKTLKKPGYAGLREFKGEIIGKTSYPSIVDEGTFNAAQVALALGSQMSQGHNARRYLLTGFIACGNCGTGMKGAPSGSRKPRYRCASNYGGCGTTSIRVDWVDGPVAYAMRRRALTRRDAPLPTVDANSERDLSALIKDIEDAHEMVRSRRVSMSTVASLLADLERQKDSLLRERSIREAAIVSRPLQSEYLNWWRANLSQRRLLLGREIKRVVISKSPTVGRNSIDLSRIEITYQDGSRERLSNALLAEMDEPQASD